jgi:hypothetical protein
VGAAAGAERVGFPALEGVDAGPFHRVAQPSGGGHGCPRSTADSITPRPCSAAFDQVADDVGGGHGYAGSVAALVLGR